jgi:outer membrane protein OmpA-like peptidoglycan-associated protein
MQHEIGYYLHHTDYKEAIRLLNSEEYKFPQDAVWNFYMGKCLYETDKLQESRAFFIKSDTLGLQERDLNYYLGDLFHLNSDFALAKNYFLNYLQYTETEVKALPARIEEVKKRIIECEHGMVFKSNARPIEIFNLGSKINSEYPDYAPVISADEQTLFFTSRRPTSVGGLKDARDGWHLEDIFECVKDSLNNWSSPMQMPGYINSTGHDANIGLSPDGQRLFIYRDDELEEGLSGDIYVSDWKFQRWSTPLLMPKPINSPYWETGATVTPDEKTMYFSSNRPGGLGGLDIYMVKLLPNGEWAIPLNLGPNINTEHDDESPFIHPDGRTLYFSSEGHNSMGGFDIFYSEFEDSTWTEPVNLGYPLNTGQNELYFVLSADARRGYFSGVREENYGDKDIYVANLPERPVQIILLKGRVIDKETEEALATLIKVYDNETKKLVYVLNSNAVNGRFSSILPPHKNYNIQVEVEQAGYAHYSVNIHVPDQKEFVEIDTIIRLQRDDTIHVVTLLPNIFFKLNLSEIDSTSELELDALAKRMFQNQSLNLEVAVHTYSQRTKIENKKLAQRRAESIKIALVSRGVEANRIFPVGYGDEFPGKDELMLWKNNGTKPKDRSEAIIIPGYNSDMEPNSDGYYYKQGFKPHNSEIAEEGFLEEGLTEEIISENKTDQEESAKEEKPIPQLDELMVNFKFNRIYFRDNPDSVLAIVIDYLEKNKDLNLEIRSYTDSMGHPDYNIFLSQIRADHVKKTMVEKGVDSERLISVGLGQANPRHDNSTIEGRLLNRRAEFVPVRKKN